MLGKVILPPLTSGEGESTCRIIVSDDGAGDAGCSDELGPDVAVFEDAIWSDVGARKAGVAGDLCGWKPQVGRTNYFMDSCSDGTTQWMIVLGVRKTKQATTRLLKPCLVVDGSGTASSERIEVWLLPKRPARRHSPHSSLSVKL